MKWVCGLVFLAMMGIAQAQDTVSAVNWSDEVFQSTPGLLSNVEMESKSPPSAPVSCPSTQPMVAFSSTHTGCVLYWLSINGATIAGVRDLKTNTIVEQPALNLHYEGK